MKKHVEHFLIGKKHEEEAQKKRGILLFAKKNFVLFPSIIYFFFGIMYPFKKINEQQGFLQDLRFREDSFNYKQKLCFISQ
jgi:hypothetical protein